MSIFIRMLAGALGFEPRSSEPKSDVLPLHHAPVVAGRRDSNPRPFDWVKGNSGCFNYYVIRFYQLNYFRHLVRPAGFEPATKGL